jgi:hypothetical protein
MRQAPGPLQYWAGLFGGKGCVVEKANAMVYEFMKKNFTSSRICSMIHLPMIRNRKNRMNVANDVSVRNAPLETF